MSIAFLYALGFLLVVPHVMGYESFGIFGIVVGCLGAWMVIGLAKVCESGKTEDEEILGTYVTEARYYEPWTEKIEHEDEETGKKTYETVEHDEEWEITVAEGDTFSIDEEEYQEYVALFGNEDEKEADHEGEAEGEIIDPGYSTYTTWPGTYETASYEYVYRSYKNPTLRSSNVYASEKLDEQTIKTYHLESYGRKGLYGTVKGEDAEQLEDEIRDYNCWSREKNIKLNFILLENATSAQGIYWQQYWQNGKRNTINAVVGVTPDHKIEWAHVFGWQNEATCIKLRNFIVGLSTIADITSHFSQVEEILKENYQLPNLSEYDLGKGSFPLKGTLIALTICLGLFCGLFSRPPQYNIRAQKYLEQRQYSLAKSNFQEYLHRVPDDVYALNNLGVIYWRENNLEEAEKLFSQALRNSYSLSRGDVKDLYVNRGICYKDLKQNKHAIADMKKAIEYEEYGTKSYCALYSLYKTLGYKKSMWALQEEYNNHVRSPLNEDCRDYRDSLTYIYDGADMFTGRGFERILRKIFS